MHDDEKNDKANQTDRMPALLAALGSIRDDDVKRIVQTRVATRNETSCLARFRLAFASSHSKRMRPHAAVSTSSRRSVS